MSTPVAAPPPTALHTTESLAKLRHDLRTCFNPILGHAEMIGEDAEDLQANSADEVDRRDAVLAQGTSLRIAAEAMLDSLMQALSVSVDEASPEYLRQTGTALLKLLAPIQQQTDALRTMLHSGFPASTSTSLQAIVRAAGLLETQLVSLHEAGPEPAEVHREQPELQEESAGRTSSDAGAAESRPQSILIVDDQEENRTLLEQRLRRDGFHTLTASGGEQALRLLAEEPVDLVLLDILMEGMSGIEVLQRAKADPALRAIPVIMLSSLSEIQSVVRCLEYGAEDYIHKPFNSVLLRARIAVTLERRRLSQKDERQRMELQAMLAELAEQRGKTHELLLNILPEKVAHELQHGHSVPMYFEDTTICFTDFVGFTLSTENMAAEHVVEELHTYFSAFDRVMDRYAVEKMKTIGDSYMFASGLPKRHPGNPVNAVLAAIELAHETEQLGARPEAPGWEIRIGMHTGPVIAGVVGIRKFAFDIWGDSVNFASRMESSGKAGRINISERTYARVKDFFQCEPRGKVTTKDGRDVEMYFVRGVHPSLIADGSAAGFERRYKLYFGEAPASFPAFLLGSGR